MMEHMHTNRIIYRDLKPENLMMNNDGYLMLVDMGTAKKLKI
jgi:serine/threonine protein kinase